MLPKHPQEEKMEASMMSLPVGATNIKKKGAEASLKAENKNKYRKYDTNVRRQQPKQPKKDSSFNEWSII